MNKEVLYYLGLDWGKQTVGLAIADSEMKIASALKEIPAGDVKAEIDALRQEYRLEKVIIGMTGMADVYGNINKQQVEALAGYLQQQGMAIAYEEEQFTTKLAQHNLAQTGEKAISKRDNAEAARIILQSWLDRKSR